MLNIKYLFIKFNTKSQIDGNPFKKICQWKYFLTTFNYVFRKKYCIYFIYFI